MTKSVIECPRCGNSIIFDQANGGKTICPKCHKSINIMDEKNNLASIIKYEGDNETLVWKHPIEDFNYGSQLIVHESQEAIFFRDGRALDLFGPGRYTLETQRLPLLEKTYRLPTNTEKTFHSEVYFINKTVQMAIKWGTPDKVRFIDPLTSVPLEIGASGELNLQVSDSRKLLLKLVGTMGGIAWEDREGFTKSVQNAFRPLIVSAIRSNLPSIIKDQQIDLLEIDERVDDISANLREKIILGFEEYGLTIPQLYVTHIVLPEDDPYFKRIRELHTVALQTRTYQAEALAKTAQAQSEAAYRAAQEESKAAITIAQRKVELERQTTETEVARREAERMFIKAQAEAQAQRVAGLTEAEIMRAKGYNEKDVLQAEVQKAYAAGLGEFGSNGGGSGLGEVAGLGVAIGAMGGVANIAKEMLTPMFNTNGQVNEPANSWNCSCGMTGITSNFCPNCGEKKSVPQVTWTCSNCGTTNAIGNFCPNCGARKPLNDVGWDCTCGQTNIKSNFCPNCGKKRSDVLKDLNKGENENEKQ